MPEDTGAGTGTNPGTGNEAGAGGGTDPTTTSTPAAPQAFDPKTIGDDDFNKVFEDPRVWNHPRFKSLNEQAKKAKEYEAQEEARKNEELKKKGEWEAVAKANEEKATKAQAELTTERTNTRIFAEASKLGAVDLEAVKALIDRSKIVVNDDGTVTGVEEAVKDLLESKPYLKGTPGQTTVGQGTAPGAETTQGLKRFKLSQIQDPVFYRANEADIQASMKNNLVEDDLNH